METLVEETAAAPSDAGRHLAGTKSGRTGKQVLKDVAIIVLILAVIAALVGFIVYRMGLKRDISSATKITDKVVTAIADKNGKAAYSLGNTKFQKTYTTVALSKQFEAIELVTGGDPTVDSTALVKNKGEKVAFITYKYPPKLANQSFYILVGVTQQSDGSWKLTDISGSADKSKLLQ